MSEFQVVLLPGTLALLPDYASEIDPIPELRAAVGQALEWLGQEATQSIHVVCVDATEANQARGATVPPAARLMKALAAAHFPAELPEPTDDSVTTVVVVANGSAMRDEKAPGHFDARAADFDAAIEAALRAGDGAALAGVDAAVAEQLWCEDAPSFHRLGEIFASGTVSGRVLLSQAPFGVQYWVGSWRVVTD